MRTPSKVVHQAPVFQQKPYTVYVLEYNALRGSRNHIVRIRGWVKPNEDPAPMGSWLRPMSQLSKS